MSSLDLLMSLDGSHLLYLLYLFPLIVISLSLYKYLEWISLSQIWLSFLMSYIQPYSLHILKNHLI